jgi:hypothetical protein
MFTVNCPHCQHAMEEDGSLAGRQVLCPECRGQFAMPHFVAASRRSPRAKSSRARAPIVAVAVAAGLVVVAIASLALLVSRSPSVNPFVSESERIAAKYLSENLPDPHYSVILREGPFANPGSGGTVFRLKFRSQNPFGGNSVHDMIFFIRNGEVESQGNFDFDPQYRRFKTLTDWVHAHRNR